MQNETEVKQGKIYFCQTRGFNPKTIVRDKGDYYTIIKASI